MIAQPRVVSLWDMLELNAQSFLGAATQIARMRQILAPVREDEPLTSSAVRGVSDSLMAFRAEAANVGAKLACVSADRLIAALSVSPCPITLVALSGELNSIESRFADHLMFIKLFVIHEERSGLFSGASVLLGHTTAALYPSAWFDCEEAAKCICLGRATACVFHCMRMLEIGIKALSLRLGLAEPACAADRSWGRILRIVKDKIDVEYPVKSRIPNSDGSFLEEVYVSLDAVKNPWRNGTMHVDLVYTEQEAQFILQCTAVLLQKMATGFDETGTALASSALLPAEVEG